MENSIVIFNRQEQYGNTFILRTVRAFTIHFVLLPVGHLTSSITVPDALTGGAPERLATFQAIGTVVG